MAYRNPSQKPPNPECLLNRYIVRNGATLKLDFDCYYMVPGHDPHYHDYKNWPAPNYHPGDVCQILPPRDIPRFMTARDMLYGRPCEVAPIHLLDEGYSEAVIVFEDTAKAAHVTTETWIDEEDDNIVRLRLDAMFDTFTTDPIELKFTLFVKKTYTDPETNITRTTKDAVEHGIIVVVPGAPYPTE